MEDHLRFAVCYWHSFAWDGFDIFGAGTLDRPWHPTFAPGVDPMAAAEAEDGRRLRVLRQARRAVLLLPRPRHRTRGRDVQGVGGNLDEMVDVAAEHQQRTGVRAAVGHGQPVLQPALPGRRGDQPRPRGVRLRGRAGRPLPRGDAPSGRRTTTCCGAAARATRRCSTPTSSASSTSSARFLSMVVEHKQRIGFEGTILHRAEAVRADQAPVRLRRRRGVRVPAALRPRRRDQGQHRGQPRHARRATTSPTRSPRRSTPGSSARSTPTPATTGSAGTSTASRCRSSR